MMQAGWRSDEMLPRYAAVRSGVRAERSAAAMLTQDDLLWFESSEDAEGPISLGLVECSPRSIGVLVDDNGEPLGLQLSRAEAQDLEVRGRSPPHVMAGHRLPSDVSGPSGQRRAAPAGTTWHTAAGLSAARQGSASCSDGTSRRR